MNEYTMITSASDNVAYTATIAASCAPTIVFGLTPIGVYVEVFELYPANMYNMNPYMALKYNPTWVRASRPDLCMLEESLELMYSAPKELELINGVPGYSKFMEKAFAISPLLAYVIDQGWLRENHVALYMSVHYDHMHYDTGLTHNEINRAFSLAEEKRAMMKLVEETHT